MPASLAPALPTHDLRSGAKAYKRDKSHTAKYQNGTTKKGCTPCPQQIFGVYSGDCLCGQCTMKPAGPWKHNVRHIKAVRLEKEKDSGRAFTMARKAFRNEVVAAMDEPDSDLSSDGEITMATATAPLPAEANFMYSYDAKAGPAEGTNILSHAINVAVKRFENTETEKLVSKEYDVIDEAKEGYTADEDDDDFEMIEHSHLK